MTLYKLTAPGLYFLSFLVFVQGKRTTLQAVINNATGENYWSSDGNNLLGVGLPRTFKVVAKVEL